MKTGEYTMKRIVTVLVLVYATYLPAQAQAIRTKLPDTILVTFKAVEQAYAVVEPVVLAITTTNRTLCRHFEKVERDQLQNTYYRLEKLKNLIDRRPYFPTEKDPRRLAMIAFVKREYPKRINNLFIALQLIVPTNKTQCFFVGTRHDKAI